MYLSNAKEHQLVIRE